MRVRLLSPKSWNCHWRTWSQHSPQLLPPSSHRWGRPSLPGAQNLACPIINKPWTHWHVTSQAGSTRSCCFVLYMSYILTLSLLITLSCDVTLPPPWLSAECQRIDSCLEWKCPVDSSNLHCFQKSQLHINTHTHLVCSHTDHIMFLTRWGDWKPLNLTLLPAVGLDVGSLLCILFTSPFTWIQSVNVNICFHLHCDCCGDYFKWQEKYSRIYSVRDWRGVGCVVCCLV